MVRDRTIGETEVMGWVEEYKAICSRRCADILGASTTSEALIRALGDVVAESAVDDQMYHRMWFDLRNQCMFDHELRRPVREVGNLLEDLISQVLERHAELVGSHREISITVAVATVDALFQQAVASATNRHPDATGNLSEGLRIMLGGTA